MNRFDISWNLWKRLFSVKTLFTILPLNYLECVEQSLLCYWVETIWTSAVVAQPDVVTDSLHIQISEVTTRQKVHTI
jgi:hypothetical protein